MALLDDLYPHQLAAMQRLQELHGRAGLFVALGGGKTRVALRYAQTRSAQRMLVVAPLSVTSVWEAECRKIDFALDTHDLTEVNGVKERAGFLRRINSGLVLVNPESYWREPLRSSIVRWGPTTIIWDEIHRIRNRGARHARFAHSLADLPSVQTRLGLSGTALTNGLQDAWSEFRFIQPTLFGRWADFQGNYLKMGGYKGYQIIGYRQEEQARKLISSASFQWDSELPSPPDTKVIVRLTPKTRAVYESLRQEAITTVQGWQVSGRIKLTLILRLQQLTSGFAREEGGECIDLKTYEKARVAYDLVSDAVAQGRRVVVFARFLWELDTLQRGFQKTFRVARIDGDVSSANRKLVISGFDGGQYDVCLVQLRAAIGIDLASASVGIFVSADYSLDVMLQAKGRLTGALRQRHPVTFYHLIAERTVDGKMYDALQKKVNIAARFTDARYALDFFTD